jgi:hypothetical protein
VDSEKEALTKIQSPEAKFLKHVKGCKLQELIKLKV